MKKDETIPDRPERRFLEGERYRVGGRGVCAETGSVIEILRVEGKRVFYRTVRGRERAKYGREMLTDRWFSTVSLFARELRRERDR